MTTIYRRKNPTTGLPETFTPTVTCRRSEAHRALDMRTDKAGAAWMTRWKPPTKITARDRENHAACRALGLSFWAETPQPNHLWAVDWSQRVHIVGVNRKELTAVHMCAYRFLHRDYQGTPMWETVQSCPCVYRQEASWSLPDDNNELFDVERITAPRA